mmetsp:Transcript_65817/g.174510  ORF Transcript_65817/g.174510 Transcript_65817/m.174510 type:complete len:83 (-) Transcript_65817:530-778(-)
MLNGDPKDLPIVCRKASLASAPPNEVHNSAVDGQRREKGKRLHKSQEPQTLASFEDLQQVFPSRNIGHVFKDWTGQMYLNYW